MYYLPNVEHVPLKEMLVVIHINKPEEFHLSSTISYSYVLASVSLDHPELFYHVKRLGINLVQHQCRKSFSDVIEAILIRFMAEDTRS